VLPLLGAAPTAFLAALDERRRYARGAFLDNARVPRGARTGARICCSPPDQIPWTKSYFTWISAGGFRADFALQVDQLTIIMLLVVTGVGWLIHIYSTGYMHDDPGYRRFFSYLNLFMFFHVVAGARCQLPVDVRRMGGVGLCSYLLIGFFFLKQSATNAGNKAFWVNRIGDFGFILGLLLILRTFGTLDFATVLPRAAAMPAEQQACSQRLPCSCFVGAAGKSAQLPLYVWLPDAMEGPTPVSALIHAATMSPRACIWWRVRTQFSGMLPWRCKSLQSSAA